MGKIYFASDFHLGVDAADSSADRERRIVRWLNSIQHDADEIFLAGDLFDYWFEYRTVVPKGFTRFLGKLGEIRDTGVPIHVFTGNHDMWMFGYFQDELGIPVHREPVEREFSGKRFIIGHGDGLGPGDKGYKFIKAVFASPVSQWIFARLHPNLAIPLMKFFSGQSRESTEELQFLGADKEWLIQYCDQVSNTGKVDYFIFGHRHLPIDWVLENGQSRYINLGDWLRYNSYAVFDGNELELKFFEGGGRIIRNPRQSTTENAVSTEK